MHSKCFTTSGGTSRLAADSAEIAINADDAPPRGKVRRFFAAISGESTRVLSGTSPNCTVLGEDSCAKGSEVLYFHPAGSRMLARNGSRSFGRLGG
jgi:hypothetical protein